MDTSTARNKASKERRQARDRWNMEELSIGDLFSQYDEDESGYLEQSEIMQLLADHNGGKRPSREEYTWLMKIADKNHDDRISLTELSGAMQAWHGYSNLSPEYAEMFDKFDVDHNGSLDVMELKELLTAINDGKEVSDGEAMSVMRTAATLGDGKLGRYELLGAVGTWYVSVGRKPTPEMAQAMAALKQKPALNYAGLFVNLLLGILCIYYGQKYQVNQCKEDLDGLLIAQGSIYLGVAVMMVLVTQCCMKISVGLTACGGIMMMVLSLLNQVVDIVGIVWVWGIDTPEEVAACGNDLHHICWWLFVFPFLLSLALVSCLCCCMCVGGGLAAAMGATADHEEHFQNESEGQRGMKYQEMQPLRP